MKTLLQRNWKLSVFGCISVFLIYEFAIFFNNTFSSSPLCLKAGLTFYDEWVTYSRFIFIGCNVSLILFILMKFVRSKQSADILGVSILALIIISLTCLSNVLSMSLGWGGVCVDAFGVYTLATTWGEWLSCTPTIMFLCVSITNNERLTIEDFNLILSVFLSIFFGFLMVLTNYIWLASIFLAISVFFFTWVSWVIYRTSQKLKDITYPIHQSSENFCEVSVSDRRRRRSTLLIAFFGMITLRVIVYLVAVGGAIDRNVTLVGLMISDIFCKLLITAAATEEHIEVMNPLALDLIREKSANEARREFLRYIFHEVRVPLHTVTMGIDLLEDCGSLNDSEMGAVHMMKDASRFMSETLNAVLTMQKIEQGKLELQMQPFCVAGRVKRLVKLFEGMARGNNIAIRVEIHIDPTLMVIGDHFQLDHVTANFLSNAIKFAKPYSTVTVVVEGREPVMSTRSDAEVITRVVSVSVRDEGPGISQDDIAKLFTPFTQIRPGELQQGRGTGVGLSICKQIVKLHGGQIGCESEVGVGSVFSYTIPFVVAADSLTRWNSDEELELRGAGAVEEQRRCSLLPKIPTEVFSNHLPRQSIMKLERTLEDPDEERGDEERSDVDNDFSEIGNVLVVDDVASNRKMLSLLLGKRKVRTEMAEDGADVVAMARTGSWPVPFQMIIMDNQMPKMPGGQAVRQLRTLGFCNLVIGLTASALNDDVAAYVEAGADLVLSKPLQLEQLDGILRFVRREGCVSRAGHLLARTADGRDLEWAGRFPQELV